MVRIEIGQKFNRLTLLCVLPGVRIDRRVTGRWQCDCGRITVLPLNRVRLGYTRSCGCLRSEPWAATHGYKGTPTYASWQAMLDRCRNDKSKDYARYGARGIVVCRRWRSFDNFLSDMGERPFGTTLDRIDGRRGYKPGNCRWATVLEQARNRKNFTVLRTPLGVLPLVDYAAIIDITRGAAHLRLKRGKLEGCAKI